MTELFSQKATGQPIFVRVIAIFGRIQKHAFDTVKRRGLFVMATAISPYLAGHRVHGDILLIVDVYAETVPMAQTAKLTYLTNDTPDRRVIYGIHMP